MTVGIYMSTLRYTHEKHTGRHVCTYMRNTYEKHLFNRVLSTSMVYVHVEYVLGKICFTIVGVRMSNV